MIDDDYIDACIMRHAQRLMRHRAAIDGDDQARTFLAQFDQRLARRAVSFEQSIGNVIAGLHAEIAQQPDQQRGTGRAIDIVIAVDGDLFAGKDSLCDPVRRGVHIAKKRRIGQEVAQCGGQVAVDILRCDPARQ